MLDKENLQKEIFRKTEYNENFFYGKFNETKVNQSFNRLTANKNKTLNIISGIFYILFQCYLMYDFIRIELEDSFFIIFFVITLIIDIITLIIICLTDGSSNIYNIFIIIKYISHLIFIYICLIYVSVYLEWDKIYVFSKILMIGYFLSAVEFTLMIFYSRFLVL